MAKSPAHTFGQEIGNLFEEVITPALQEICESRGLFLDKKGLRGEARPGRKVTWQDQFGNSHDLDFVIERNGTPDKLGVPVAFIESAWRRYTKHSKNKAQEIQGAVLSVVEKHRLNGPITAVLLAGEFTEPSIQQLRSLGFHILYIPYEGIIKAFDAVGIDARFDEDTKDSQVKKKLDALRKLDLRQRKALCDALFATNRGAINSFIVGLERALDRSIKRVIVIPLFGTDHEFSTKEDAIDFLNSYKIEDRVSSFKKYEVLIEFSNGDKVDGVFSEKAQALRFINAIQ